MADTTARSSTRLDPGPAWTIVTDAPLKGLVMAREAMRVLAWDEAGGDVARARQLLGLPPDGEGIDCCDEDLAVALSGSPGTA